MLFFFRLVSRELASASSFGRRRRPAEAATGGVTRHEKRAPRPGALPPLHTPTPPPKLSTPNSAHTDPPPPPFTSNKREAARSARGRSHSRSRTHTHSKRKKKRCVSLSLSRSVPRSRAGSDARRARAAWKRPERVIAPFEPPLGGSGARRARGRERRWGRPHHHRATPPPFSRSLSLRTRPLVSRRFFRLFGREATALVVLVLGASSRTPLRRGQQTEGGRLETGVEEPVCPSLSLSLSPSSRAPRARAPERFFLRDAAALARARPC